MCRWGTNGLLNGPIPDLPLSTLTPKRGIEIAANQLEIDVNINRARLRRHFLALNLCHQSRK